FSERSPDHILPDIILFGQVEELTDPASSFGSQAARDSAISQPRNVLLTLPDNDQVENAEVGINDAAADRLAFTLTSTARAVTGVTLAEEETHTSLGQHTLLHGEALFVIASTDADNIS
ncbi:hypothetical protein MZO44_15720, partial [Lactiplantibacillus sp. E932]|nr:hypothetical protein [Lactiplantibacillus sp. E932]